jgi:hypothetical protein
MPSLTGTGFSTEMTVLGTGLFGSFDAQGMKILGFQRSLKCANRWKII